MRPQVVGTALVATFMCTALAAAEEYPADEEETRRPLVPGGVDDKPFLLGSGNARIGGYIDAQAVYEREEGFPSEAGFTLERLNLFTFASISPRVRVISELEIEDGGDELVLELAVVDIDLGPQLNLRAGMILVPIGRFNLAHDSPANLMVDRPLTSEQLIPGTLSEPGLGAYGAVYPTDTMRITYEAYLVNGLGSGIANNASEGTQFQNGKGNLEDENRHPSAVARVAFSPVLPVEIGLSVYGGPWNQYTSVDGPLDKKRWLGIFVFDAVADLSWGHFAMELVQTAIDLPPTLPDDVFAQSQRGLFVEGSVPILEDFGLIFPKAALRGTMRYDFVDRNAQQAGDDTHRLSVGASWLPTPDTAIKFNFQRSRSRDIGLNVSNTAALQLGVASYF